MEEMDVFGSNKEVHPKKLDRSLYNTLGLTSTLKGVFKKFTMVGEDGVLYYIKTGKDLHGDYSTIHPAIEALVYDLSRPMGFDCVPQKLAYLDKETMETEKDVLVSMSPNFVESGYEFLPFSKLITGTINVKSDNIYAQFQEVFYPFVNDLNRMIVMDYVFDNPDRHLNNFGILYHTEIAGMKFAPLYDNGLALLGQYAEHELPRDNNLVYLGRAQPFRSKQKNAITLVKDLKDLDLNFTQSAESFMWMFDKYSKYFSAKRLTLMKKMFELRYTRVRIKWFADLEVDPLV